MPGARRQTAPGVTWAVNVKESSGYVQGNFKGDIGGMSYSGNVGARFIRTTLNVTQDNVGDPGQYGTEAAVTGQEVTRRSYTDVLPAVNFALNVTPKFTVRAAISKNMQPLDLSQWGGGLTLNYSSYQTPQGLQFQVSQGDSTGNPHLNPWRSTNYGVSLEYYLNPSSLINLELFHINVQSFIVNGNTSACGLPDEDGVVRDPNRCIQIVQPLQGSGNSIQGAEFDYRQGFTFLPGLSANTGIEFNVTYAPSHTGERDLAGNEIPFQDNSTESGNLILWYQSSRFQTRLAYNYRSKRAAEDGVGGIVGLELYEAPQKYLDASVVLQGQQVRGAVRERHQPHERVPALLPCLARPACALEFLRAHVYGRRSRAVVSGAAGIGYGVQFPSPILTKGRRCLPRLTAPTRPGAFISFRGCRARARRSWPPS